MDYAVIIEKGEASYSAYVPDLPGCVAAAESRMEVLQLIREAIEMHVADLRREGAVVPLPVSDVEIVHIDG
jgi:predicted RNase H-like HicB family nuclease